MSERQPLLVHCGDCAHEWPALYLPLVMDKRGQALMKSAAKAPCPMCAGTNVFVGAASKGAQEIVGDAP